MATNHKRGYFDRSETDRHRCSVLGMLDFLREDDKLCDVTITVEDKKFRAHKNVLSSSSDYFYSMFTSDFQEKNLDEIELEGRSESFKRLLGYAYTGDMEIDDLSTDDAIDLLNMAAYLQLKHAVKLLSQVLLRALECGFANLAEMYRIWELADLLAKGMCIDELATTALDLLAKHFIEFSQLELFNSDVSSAFLEKCLKRNSVAAIVPEDEGEQKDGKKEKAAKGECKKMRKLVKEMNLEGITEEVLEERFKREEKILDILTTWLFYDWSRRQTCAYLLLRTLRLGYLSKGKVKELLDTRIGKHPDCRQLLKGDESCQGFSQPRGLVTVPVLLGTKTVNNIVKVYDRKKGVWKEVTPKFEPKVFKNLSKYRCLAIGNHLYVCGGVADSEAKNNFCRYDITEHPSQLVLSDMINPRYECAMVHVDHYIYVVGGIETRISDIDMETRTAERYDINQVRYDSMILEVRRNPWEQIKPLPANCWRPHGVGYKGKVLVCGLSKRPPKVNYLVHRTDDPPIEYVMYMYDPITYRWDHYVLEERPVVHCMQGRPNFMMLMVHKGECYLVGTMEIDAVGIPRSKWFRMTANKLVFEEEGSRLRFIEVGESSNQELFDRYLYSSFFYIGNDIFYRWRHDLIYISDVKMTDDNFKEELKSYDTFPNGFSESFSAAQVDIKYLEDD